VGSESLDVTATLWEGTRRSFLQRLGVGMAAAAAPMALPDGAGASEHVHETLRLRRWAMVVDQRYCDGCAGLGVPPQCTQYCTWGRIVPEGMEWIEVYRPVEERGGTEMPAFLAAPCMQCENAPCVNVCPVGATFHNPEGVVLIDQERCIGCRLCMAACPYDRRFFNWEEPVQPAMVREHAYDVQTQVPAIKGTVMKCDFCTDRAEAGGLPYCIEGCPRGALWFGDLEEDIASNGREVVSLSRFLDETHAVRFKEELGTEPRVFYIRGQGELAEPERATEHEQSFLKGGLEWPWRTHDEDVAAALAAGAPEETP